MTEIMRVPRNGFNGFLRALLGDRAGQGFGDLPAGLSPGRRHPGGVLTPYLAHKYPKTVRHSCEPLFFDPALSFGEKPAQWRTQPKISLQPMTTVLMPSVLAVAVASLG